MGAVDLVQDTPPVVEKRRFPRFRESLPFALTAHAECAHPPGIGPAIVFRTTDDVSEGGLRFQHKSILKIGTLLKVFLMIPETFQLVCRTAMVRSCQQLDHGDQFSTGLHFVTDADPADPWSAYIRAKVAA
jgi:hypothetical protein